MDSQLDEKSFFKHNLLHKKRKCNYSEPCKIEEKIANHACMNERFFWNFIWREATSRCSVSGIEMGL